MILLKETRSVNQSVGIDRRMFSQEYLLTQESLIYLYEIATLRSQ